MSDRHSILRGFFAAAIAAACLGAGVPAEGQAPAGAAATGESPAPAAAGALPASTCLTCHLDLGEPSLTDPATNFAADAHNREGLGCPACHGGDPRAEDPEASMDPRRGFVGRPAVAEVPRLCGECHADSAFIKRFAPNLPTDQLPQYRTSVHGQRLAAGDTQAATCISCHGVHGILPAEDPRSSVYPARVVDTCAACHADAGRMGPYGIAHDQVEKYRRSVHNLAIVEKNDLSAPTCNDCHGSHGAAPPGVDSVSNVCGTCHPLNMEMFNASAHREPFTDLGFGACEACHGNHEILSPGDDWVGLEGKGVCGECHSPDDAGGAAAVRLRRALGTAVGAIEQGTAEVREAERRGMLMEEAEVSLEGAREELIHARAKVHQVAYAALAEHVDAALGKAGEASAAAAAARQEIRYRRRGLLIALILILLAGVAFILKIRQIERDSR